MALKEGVFAWFFSHAKSWCRKSTSVLLSQRSHFKKKGKGEVPKNTISNFVLWDPPPVWFSFAAFTWLCNFLVESSPRRFNLASRAIVQHDGRNWTFVEKFRGRQTLKIEVPNRFQVCNKSIVDIIYIYIHTRDCRRCLPTVASTKVSIKKTAKAWGGWFIWAKQASLPNKFYMYISYTIWFGVEKDDLNPQTKLGKFLLKPPKGF